MTEEFTNPDDETVRSLLEGAQRIAVVGLSPKPHRDSHRVSRYMLERGYEIVPVYPREDEIFGQKVYRRVSDVPGRIDIVDVFRRSDQLPATIDDVLGSEAMALWLQIGCIEVDGALRARDRGLAVVMDRCIMVDHRRLLGASWTRP